MNEGECVKALLRVEIAYALPERQVLIELGVEAGTTAGQAIDRSGVLSIFPGIELWQENLGIFGKPIEPGTLLRDGDRVEIYRSLVADPKEIRRRRGRKKR